MRSKSVTRMLLQPIAIALGLGMLVRAAVHIYSIPSESMTPTLAVGDQIVVTTTDWYPSHSELRTILAPPTTVTTAAGPRTQLTVAALDYPHVSSIFDAAVLEDNHGATFTGPVNRKAADLRAAVGLLSRSIQVRSLGVEPQAAAEDPGFPEVADCLAGGTPKPECYFGGHVMFRQGFRDVQVQGVEFKQLGQGGRQGHYPVHFHFAKNTAYTKGRAFVKDSAIWDSMTRFAVPHGSHGVTLARNVGYLSVGSGYYLEDGSEIENKLCHNLGIGARASLREYFAAQARPTPLPVTARYVPPIIDGVLPTAVPAPMAANRAEKLTGSDTYMPVMFWIMNTFNELVGWERNNFDRVVHFAYGLLLAYPIREIFLRVANVRGFWGYFLPLDLTMSTSMIFELFEWAAAEIFGGDLGEAYLGTQGDPWDAHKDMALASLGALIAMLGTYAINRALQRDFAAEWAESLRVKMPQP